MSCQQILPKLRNIKFNRCHAHDSRKQFLQILVAKEPTNLTPNEILVLSVPVKFLIKTTQQIKDIAIVRKYHLASKLQSTATLQQNFCFTSTLFLFQILLVKPRKSRTKLFTKHNFKRLTPMLVKKSLVKFLFC